MKVKGRKSIISGEVFTYDLDIDLESWNDWSTGKKLVQDAFPHLKGWEKEFLISGMSKEEQDDFFEEDC